MDWINHKSNPGSKGASLGKKKSHRPASLKKQVFAALAHPTSVWSSGLDHALASIKWPTGCSPELTWLWSTVIQEQAEVLVRAGVSARQMSRVIDPAGHVDEKSRMAAVSGLMHQPLESILFEWLEQSDAYPQAALGTMATLWHLPEHARRTAPEALGKWVKEVTEQIVQRQSQQCDCLLGNLVFHCELPLLLDLLTANPQPAGGEIASRAMDDLAEYLENSREHIEAWLAHGASYLRSALACVFRCRVLADHLQLRSWYPPQRKALAELLEHAARWARHDGTQLLGSPSPNSSAHSLWKTLCKQASASDRLQRTLELAGLLSTKPSNRHKAVKLLPELSHHQEQAQCATMRYSWFHRGCGLALDFSESPMQLEAVGPKGVSLLRGQWSVQVALEGQLQYQMDGWEQICWFSDQDVDYIELEAKFGENARVQRQLILIRKHRFALAADALLGLVPGNWTITSEFPLCPEVQWQPTESHTEGFLVGKGLCCPAIPLFLPEWRSQAHTGSLQCHADRLVVTNATHGAANLYSPVVFGLANRLASHPYTWRQLTVGENLQIVPRDSAAAFRLQFGKKQFLFYRNLSEARKRTVLGVHLMSDFFAGRIDKDSGDAESLVEIDATEPSASVTPNSLKTE
jgi:hypothetical protein